MNAGRKEDHAMPQPEMNRAIADWLKGQGYSDAEVEKILTRLADHDHQTLSDAVFDSIGNKPQKLDEIIREALGG
jgi:hypothetical protein